MRVLVSGSHGLIGRPLVDALQAQGHEVIRLVRQDRDKPDEISWDQSNGVAEFDAFEAFDAVIHLAGRPIGERRWTAAEKARLWDSRVISTEMLSRRLAEAVQRPHTLIVASGVGFYGDGKAERLTEKSPKGSGFLADLVEMWEDATTPASEVGIRVVNLRSGVVLSPNGGALARQLPLFKLCLGGRLGAGTQYLSWISLDDEVRAIVHALDNRKLSGPVNLCAPHSVTNVEFTKTLASILHRPAIFPVARWMLNVSFGKEND